MYLSYGFSSLGAKVFTKESTNQLCRRLTEVQDTVSVLSKSWFTFINVKESVFNALLEFSVLVFDFYKTG